MTISAASILANPKTSGQVSALLTPYAPSAAPAPAPKTTPVWVPWAIGAAIGGGILYLLVRGDS
jgi:hypothetical protein